VLLIACLLFPIPIAFAASQALAPPVNSQSGAGAQSVSASCAQPAQFDAAGEAQLVTMINQARAEHGLQPLTVDQRLTQAARKHTQLMVQHATLSHQFEGEPTLQIRIANEDLPADSVSENVGVNNRNIAAAHDGFMHSPPHRAAILDTTFTVVGVGVVRAGDEIYVTEDFARKLPEYSEPQAEAAAQTAIEQYVKSQGFRAPGRRPQLQLRRMACSMAHNDALNGHDPLGLPGVRNALAWTAADPAKLPKGIAQLISPATSGYALGACFAPSVSHPGGVYWLVMVTY
jgi:uncharacterized protein YkwD